MLFTHVAGVAALVVSQGVTDPDAVAKILKQSACRPWHYRGRITTTTMARESSTRSQRWQEAQSAGES